MPIVGGMNDHKNIIIPRCITMLNWSLYLNRYGCRRGQKIPPWRLVHWKQCAQNMTH